MNNITTSGELALDHVAYVATAAHELEKYQIAKGDILFNNKNSAELVGKAAVADSRVEGWVFNENISRIRLVESVLPEFAVLQINSPRFRAEIRQMRSASTNVAAIYTRDLKKASFFVPPIDVQEKIVAEHADLSYTLRIVQPTLSIARKRALSLRLSLLRRAFSGQLVPQDPTDEPASVLLDRIRAERVAKGDKPKRASRPRKAATAKALPPPSVPSTPPPANAIQQELPL